MPIPCKRRPFPSLQVTGCKFADTVAMRRSVAGGRRGGVGLCLPQGVPARANAGRWLWPASKRRCRIRVGSERNDRACVCRFRRHPDGVRSGAACSSGAPAARAVMRAVMRPASFKPPRPKKERAWSPPLARAVRWGRQVQRRRAHRRSAVRTPAPPEPLPSGEAIGRPRRSRRVVALWWPKARPVMRAGAPSELDARAGRWLAKLDRGTPMALPAAGITSCRFRK